MSDAEETIRRAHEASKAKAHPPKEFDIVTLKSFPVEVQEWLWEPFTPEGVFTLLCGREGIGKGLFEADENRRMTTGRADDGVVKNVGILAFEDSLRVQVRPRHDIAGADVSRVFTLVNKSDRSKKIAVDLPGDISMLKRFIVDADLSLLVIDPLITAFDSRIKPKDEKPVREVLEALQSLAEETGCTIRGIIHFNKAVGLDVLDRIMNSKAFSAVSRHTLVMGYDPEDKSGEQVIVVVAKSNVGGIGDAVVFRKDAAGVGVKRRDGTEGKVGYLIEVARRTGVDAGSVLARPVAEDEGATAEEALVRALVKGREPMPSSEFNAAMAAHLIGKDKARTLLARVGARRTKKGEGWWIVDDDAGWTFDASTGTWKEDAGARNPNTPASSASSDGSGLEGRVAKRLVRRRPG